MDDKMLAATGPGEDTVRPRDLASALAGCLRCLDSFADGDSTCTHRYAVAAPRASRRRGTRFIGICVDNAEGLARKARSLPRSAF